MSYIIEAFYKDGMRSWIGPFPTAEDATRWAEGTRAKRDWLAYNVRPVLSVV